MVKTGGSFIRSYLKLGFFNGPRRRVQATRLYHALNIFILFISIWISYLIIFFQKNSTLYFVYRRIENIFLGLYEGIDVVFIALYEIPLSKFLKYIIVG